MSHIQHFSVTGTKCASCEILIERELRKLPGVERVDASHNAARVTITVKDGVEVSAHDLNTALQGHHYVFREVAETRPATPAQKMIVALGVVLVVYFALDRSGILRYSPDAGAVTGLGAVFIVGLVAAFSSCTAVVGGLIAAVSARIAEQHPDQQFFKKMAPHFLFNAGRIGGFALLGAAVGALGSVFQLSTGLNGLLVLIIALVMIVMGVQLMDVLPARFALRPPKWLSHKVHDMAESEKPGVPLLLGAMTFFLPCGFTQSMQLLAMATGSPTQGGLIMAVFALGTTPALLGIGAVTSAAKGEALQKLTYVVGALVVALGISNVANGATLLGFTGISFGGEEVTQELTLVDGKQVIEMEVTPYGYSPKSFSVVEGVPVKWSIYGGKSMGCASTLVLPAFGVQKQLRSGYNEVTFTPTKPGKYTFSCSMGMVRGTLIVTEGS